MTRLLPTLPLVLAGCYAPPPLPPLDEGPLTIAVTLEAEVVVDAHLPGDVVALADGRAAVLDGLQGRLLLVDLTAETVTPVPLPDPPGRPVRLAPSPQGGLWLVDPAAPLRRVSVEGALLETLLLPETDPPLQPIALAEEADGVLTVASRGGALWRLTPAGSPPQRLGVPSADGAPGASWVDVVVDGDALLATDAQGARVVRLRGGARDAAGTYGRRAGTLSHPKAATPLGQGRALVVDSDLDVVSAFDLDDGRYLGALADPGGDLLRPGHSLAVRPGPSPGAVLLLDSQPGAATLRALRLAPDALAAAAAEADVRRLRTVLAEDRPVASAPLCLQCHDGLVQGGRENLDPGAAHHPELEVREDPGARHGGWQTDCSPCHTAHGEGAGGFLQQSTDEDGLCVGCHDGDPHAPDSGEDAGAHPSGLALQMGAGDGDAGCLSCHDVHAAQGPGLTRGLEDATACARCHADQAYAATSHPRAGTGGAAASLRAHGGDLPLDARGHLSCRSCHQLAGGTGGALLRGDAQALCTGCHDDVAHGDADCTTCHAPHEAAKRGALLRPAHQGAAAGDCASCHGPLSRGPGHPRVAGLSPSASGCRACHDAHSGDVTADCATCHGAQANAGGHGDVSCQTCHPAHGRAPQGPADASPRDRPCLACHAPGRGGPTVRSWTHPTPLFEEAGPAWEPLQGVTLYAPDGEAVPPGAPGALACASCHATHGSKKDHLRLDGWTATCSSCHGADALLLYRDFHAPRSRP